MKVGDKIICKKEFNTLSFTYEINKTYTITEILYEYKNKNNNDFCDWYRVENYYYFPNIKEEELSGSPSFNIHFNDLIKQRKLKLKKLYEQNIYK